MSAAIVTDVPSRQVSKAASAYFVSYQPLSMFSWCQSGINHGFYCLDIDGLVQERRNSSALAMELRLPYTNQSICSLYGSCLIKLHTRKRRRCNPLLGTYAVDNFSHVIKVQWKCHFVLIQITYIPICACHGRCTVIAWANTVATL